MKIEIDIPDEALENLKNTADGFNISLERVAAVALCDWCASIDEQVEAFGKMVSPHCQSFDLQFGDKTPEGLSISSSYELSRVNWRREFLQHGEFYSGRDF